MHRQSGNTNLRHVARLSGKSQEKPPRKTKVGSRVRAPEAGTQVRGADLASSSPTECVNSACHRAQRIA